MPTVNELKATLKAMGESTSGSKAQLEERLLAAQRRAAASASASASGKRAAASSTSTSPSKAARAEPTFAGGDKRATASSSAAAGGASGASGSGDKRARSANAREDAARALFQELAGGAGEELGVDETLAFCEKLGVDAEDVVMLYVSFKLGAPSMGSFPKDAFVTGATAMGWGSVDAVKASLKKLRETCGWGGPEFSDVYAFAYKWGCDVGQKVMRKEVAVDLWRLLIPVATFPQLEAWLSFVANKFQGKAVSRDAWLSFPRWITAVFSAGGLEHFAMDENDAWPVIIDEFMEQWRKEHPRLAAGNKA